VAVARRLAGNPTVTVLIEGETGVGKEFLARAIHGASPRSGGPFVAISCAAIPENLLESELFGHEAGAYTDARARKRGLFELAEGGTLFLDEVAEMPVSMQAKLLRAIETMTFRRVGGTEDCTVDARLIAATNVVLESAVRDRSFREDLYYRLKVLPIHTAALRDRKADIPLLADHFVRGLAERTGRRITGVTEDAMRLLMEYCWPGNVREMENSFEYAFVMCQGERIDAFDLPQEIRVAPLREQLCAEAAARVPAAARAREAEPAHRGARTALTRERLLQALEANGWNRSAAARDLGMSRVGLWKRMKSLGIEAGTGGGG